MALFLVILCSLFSAPVSGFPQRPSAAENAWFAKFYQAKVTTSTTPQPEHYYSHGYYYGYGQYGKKWDLLHQMKELVTARKKIIQSISPQNTFRYDTQKVSPQKGTFWIVGLIVAYMIPLFKTAIVSSSTEGTQAGTQNQWSLTGQSSNSEIIFFWDIQYFGKCFFLILTFQ